MVLEILVKHPVRVASFVVVNLNKWLFLLQKAATRSVECVVGLVRPIPTYVVEKNIFKEGLIADSGSSALHSSRRHNLITLN